MKTSRQTTTPSSGSGSGTRLSTLLTRRAGPSGNPHPSRVFEGFFVDMTASQFRIPEDMPAVEQSASRHNLRFAGPPLD